MSKIRILIVEDELLVAEEMKATLEEQGYQVIDIVDNTVDAKNRLESTTLDMLLVDIKLKGAEDGISLANYVTENQQLPLIFITSHVDHDTTTRALMAKPSAFLVKPYNPQGLQCAIDLAMQNFERKTAPDPAVRQLTENTHYAFRKNVFIRDNHRFERLDFEDILYLKAESSYVHIVTKVKKYLLTSDTLGSMLSKINRDWLVRVHRSYAVNIQAVEVIQGNQLTVQNEQIPIGKNYQASTKQYFEFL